MSYMYEMEVIQRSPNTYIELPPSIHGIVVDEPTDSHGSGNRS